MMLDKKNILEGVIASAIFFILVYLIGLLASAINIEVSNKPKTNSSVDWNIEIQPITVELPYVFKNIGERVSRFKTRYNNYYSNYWDNSVGMMFVVIFTWIIIYIYIPFFAALDGQSYESTNKFNALVKVFLGTYYLTSIVVFILFRDWFLVFLISILGCGIMYAIRNLFYKNYKKKELSVILNIIYAMLIMPIGMLVTIISVVLLSYIF